MSEIIKVVACEEEDFIYLQRFGKSLMLTASEVIGPTMGETVVILDTDHINTLINTLKVYVEELENED